MTRSAGATDRVKRFVSTESSESGYRNSTGTENEEENEEEGQKEEEEKRSKRRRKRS